MQRIFTTGIFWLNLSEVIDVKTESLPMISDETIIAKYKSSFLQNGDVIVADTAEDETVGKCTEIAGLSDEIANFRTTYNTLQTITKIRSRLSWILYELGIFS